MKHIIFTVLSFSFLFFACTENQNNSENQESSDSEVKEQDTGTPYLPSITLDEMESLWENCNQIDYLFYDLPISSSVNDSPSAQAHLRHISDSPVSAAVKQKCTTPLGRIFYKSDGEDIAEAEVYFSQNCAFLVFLKDGKAVSSNLLTSDGVNHFNQIIATATGKRPAQ